MQTATSSAIGSGVQSRLTSLALAALLGVFIIGIVGFSPVNALHNASHDYRHSVAFPCH